MRKSTLLTLLALFVSAAGMANDGGAKRVTGLKTALQMPSQPVLQGEAKTPAGELLQQQSGVKSLKQLMPADHQSASSLPVMPWAKRAPRKAAITYSQPAGQYSLMSRSGEAYGASLFGVLYAEVSGKVCEVVFGDRNTVYMKNIISQFNTNAWIQGTLQGNTITFELPQAIYEESGSTYYAMMMQLDASGSTYVKDERSQKLTFTIANGSITSTSDLSNGTRVVGLASVDGGWTGYADWNIVLNAVTETPATAPAGLQTIDYAISAPGVVGSIAQVGFSGNEVWVQGIYANMPEAWVHGTISGTKVTFASGQYLGADLVSGYFQYLVAATAEEAYDSYYEEYYTEYSISDGPITFDYDPATRTLSNSSCFLINAGTEIVSYAAVFDKATIKPFVEAPATPKTPQWNEISEYGFSYFYDYQYGWGVFNLDVYTEDVDGNFILPEKLSYQFYTRVNGEEKPYVFSAYDHIYMEEPSMVEVPFGYSDGWDFYPDGPQQTIYFFNGGAEAYGVQAIYRGGGEERRSEIAWYEMQSLFTDVQPEAATPDYPEVSADNVGSTITVSPYTGNEDLSSFGYWTPQTYDVAIHLQDATLTGSHIDAITFPVNAIAGTSGYKVWLSSQLRVEDNVNVPDLVSIDVEPSATGNVTVALPKPYIIPEGGVYVGYSVTIDEVIDADGGPVTTIAQVKESGMYIHMSRNLMKWTDLSEDAGMSAVIGVSVSGSAIAVNAVMPVDGSSVFAKVGDDIVLTQEFVNCGAAGIQSMDMEYTFNGKTATKHVNCNVKGQYGLATYQAFSLPAVNETGSYDFSLRVLKVNGQDNSYANVEAKTSVKVLSIVPKKRTLLEEYTGTWCGWCPRGFVALELLKKNYADDFVTISYHNGDPMEILSSSNFPSPVSGFPVAWMDRGMDIDPYGGSPYDDSYFSTLDLMQWRNAMFANAELDVKAQLNESGDEVNVAASVTFPYSDDNANFALEYVLVEDGMTGPAGTDWDQQNYYAGQTGVSADLQVFASQGEVISNLVFDDVAVGVSEIGGIAESIPQSVVADVPVEHSYTFYPEYCYNTSYEPVIQDLEQLYVVALLIDLSDGTVANAVKVKVEMPDAVGIESVNAGKQAAQAVYYNLQGQRIAMAQKGVTIVNGRKVVLR